MALFAELVGYATTFATIGYALRQSRIEDSLSIKAELKFVALFSSFAALPWFVTNMVKPAREFAVVQFPIVPLYAATIAFVMVVISIYYPLFKARALAIADARVAAQSTQTLAGVLSSADGYAAFERFLAQEFSVENLLFWTDVQLYKVRAVCACIL